MLKELGESLVFGHSDKIGGEGAQDGRNDIPAGLADSVELAHKLYVETPPDESAIIASDNITHNLLRLGVVNSGATEQEAQNALDYISSLRSNARGSK